MRARSLRPLTDGSSSRVVSYQAPQYSAHDREEPFSIHEFAVELLLDFRRLMIAAFSHILIRTDGGFSAFDTPRSIWRNFRKVFVCMFEHIFQRQVIIPLKITRDTTTG